MAVSISNICGKVTLDGIAGGSATEFLALCVDGWVSGKFIIGSYMQYELDESGGNCKVSIASECTKIDSDEALLELSNLCLGLSCLTVQMRTEGMIFEHEQLVKVLKWIRCRPPFSLDPDQSLSSQLCLPLASHLTLRDLGEIYHYLDLLAQAPIADIERDENFNRVFPCVDIYNGCYGNIRHRSGHEIFVRWIDNRMIGRHKIDAAILCSELLREYECERDGKIFRRARSSAPKPGPYRKSQRNRGRLAYMLGSVPESHKSRVYAWVVDVFNAVDYYHDTRGGVEIPERFSIEFGQFKMTATHDLVFNLE